MDPSESLHYGLVVLKAFLGHMEDVGEEVFSGFDTLIAKAGDDGDGTRKLMGFLKREMLKERDAIVEGFKAVMNKIDAAGEDALIELRTGEELWGYIAEAALEYKQQQSEGKSLVEKENAALAKLHVAGKTKTAGGEGEDGGGEGGDKE